MATPVAIASNASLEAMTIGKTLDIKSSVPMAIGVDNGGTWIRFVGLDSRGRHVWALKKPSPTVENLPGFLKKHLRLFKGRLDGLAVGSRGVWKPSKRLAVKRALRGLAKDIVVMSDVEAAWMAAFGDVGAGHRPRPQWNPISGRRSGLPLQFQRSGIIVIAGTGSIAYGRKTDGTSARAGGLGPDKGDEGSGYWIGKKWLERTGASHGKNVKTIAALAHSVILRAQRGDPLAIKITREAQAELAMLVRDVGRKLGLKHVAVSWAGSVLANNWFRKGFWKALAPLPLKRQSAQTDVPAVLARSIMGHASG